MKSGVIGALWACYYTMAIGKLEGHTYITPTPWHVSLIRQGAPPPFIIQPLTLAECQMVQQQLVLPLSSFLITSAPLASYPCEAWDRKK